MDPLTSAYRPAIDALKLMLAFMVVHIHVNVAYNNYFLPLCTIAVPIFLMISGYYLVDTDGTISTRRLKRQILKTSILIPVIQCVYLLVHALRSVLNGTPPHPIFTDAHAWFRLLLIGDSLCAPLWYLTAYLETLVFILFCVKLRIDKFVWLTIPACLFVQYMLASLVADGIIANETGWSHTLLWPAIPCVVIGILMALNNKWLPNHIVTAPIVTILCAM